MTPSIERVRSDGDWDAARAIRMEVFVEEQAVPEALELDEHDAMARHWLARVDGEPVGTARAVALEGTWKIGRVAVRAPWRGSGVGRELMRAILAAARDEGVAVLALDSQVHALPFYERLGFVAEGPEFDDAGIPHRHMRLVAPF